MTKHPAKFTDDILDAIAELLPDRYLEILDPFAGVGRIHELRERNRGWQTWGVELETEWAIQSNYTTVGNALELHTKAWLGTFDAIVTSPCYGNRMADNYAGDGTPRHSYRIYLGRDVSPGSSAGLQWGERYRVFHRRAWAEATRVVKPEGLFILNIKDHIRDGRRMPVTAFHIRALRQLGWKPTKRIDVDAPGQRQGENAELRMDYESVIRFELKETF